MCWGFHFLFVVDSFHLHPTKRIPMKITIRLLNTKTVDTKTVAKCPGILFRFGSFDFQREDFRNDKYVLSTISNDKHRLIQSVLNFYRRCSMFNIQQIKFPVETEFENLRYIRCEKLLNAGRISFDQFRNKCYYKYPCIYRGKLRNV